MLTVLNRPRSFEHSSVKMSQISTEVHNYQSRRRRHQKHRTLHFGDNDGTSVKNSVLVSETTYYPVPHPLC